MIVFIFSNRSLLPPSGKCWFLSSLYCRKYSNIKSFFFFTTLTCVKSLIHPVQCIIVIQTLFLYLTRLMKRGYQEECTRQHHPTLSPKQRPDKRNTALWVVRLFPLVQRVNVSPDCIYCIYYPFVYHVYQCLLLHHKKINNIMGFYFLKFNFGSITQTAVGDLPSIREKWETGLHLQPIVSVVLIQKSVNKALLAI